MRRAIAPVSLLLTLVSLSAADDRDTVLQNIESRRAAYADVAKQIWGFAEVGYPGQKSSALLQQQLRAAGFTVTRRRRRHSDGVRRDVRIRQTGHRHRRRVRRAARVCRRSRRPRAQHAIDGERAGHGCGHNLLGTGSLAAAIAVKEWLAAGHAGTLRYYGTPAEEGGSGKVYMVRAGLFNDVDAVVAWHPGRSQRGEPDDTSRTSPASSASAASRRTRRRRRDRGRSALDAVEAMDYMVNMMREHVPQETRIHYVITSGGAAPNVVPDFAEVVLLRAPPRHARSSTASGSASSTRRKARRSAPARRWSSRSPARCGTCCRTSTWRRDAQESRARRRLRLHAGRADSSPRSIRKTLDGTADGRDRLAGAGSAVRDGRSRQRVDRSR